MCCVFLVSKFSRLRRAHNKPGFQKCVYERRNALLPFTKRSSSRANAVPDVFTSVGTRFYYSQKWFSSRDVRLINNIIRTGGGIARRRRKFFTILPFKIQSKLCFWWVFQCISEGFSTMLELKILKNFPPPADRIRIPPLIKNLLLIRGGDSCMGGDS